MKIPFLDIWIVWISSDYKQWRHWGYKLVIDTGSDPVSTFGFWLIEIQW